MTDEAKVMQEHTREIVTALRETALLLENGTPVPGLVFLFARGAKSLDGDAYGVDGAVAVDVAPGRYAGPITMWLLVQLQRFGAVLAEHMTAEQTSSPTTPPTGSNVH